MANKADQAWTRKGPSLATDYELNPDCLHDQIDEVLALAEKMDRVESRPAPINPALEGLQNEAASITEEQTELGTSMKCVKVTLQIDRGSLTATGPWLRRLG